MTSRTPSILLAAALAVAGRRQRRECAAGRPRRHGGRPWRRGSAVVGRLALVQRRRPRPTPQPSPNIPNRPNPGDFATRPTPANRRPTHPGRPTGPPPCPAAWSIGRPNPGTHGRSPGTETGPTFGRAIGRRQSPPPSPGIAPVAAWSARPARHRPRRRPGQIGDHLGVGTVPTSAITWASVVRPNISTSTLNRQTNINTNHQQHRYTNLGHTTSRGREPGRIRPGYGGGAWPARFPSYHRGWVNGPWNGNYRPGWGWNSWGNPRPGGSGIGLAAWGVGSLLNTWGYSSYVNPYTSPSAFGVRQPAVVVEQPIVRLVAYDYNADRLPEPAPGGGRSSIRRSRASTPPAGRSVPATTSRRSAWRTRRSSRRPTTRCSTSSARSACSRWGVTTRPPSPSTRSSRPGPAGTGRP